MRSLVVRLELHLHPRELVDLPFPPLVFPLDQLGQERVRRRLQDAAEKALAAKVDELSAQVGPLFDQGDYASALTALAGLRAPVDTFFDQVMVMAEDDAVRRNRLALLNRLRNLFLRVADISLLPTAG